MALSINSYHGDYDNDSPSSPCLRTFITSTTHSSVNVPCSLSYDGYSIVSSHEYDGLLSLKSSSQVTRNDHFIFTKSGHILSLCNKDLLWAVRNSDQQVLLIDLFQMDLRDITTNYKFSGWKCTTTYNSYDHCQYVRISMGDQYLTLQKQNQRISLTTDKQQSIQWRVKQY
jgi:hypothetical protein